MCGFQQLFKQSSSCFQQRFPWSLCAKAAEAPLAPQTHRQAAAAHTDFMDAEGSVLVYVRLECGDVGLQPRGAYRQTGGMALWQRSKREQTASRCMHAGGRHAGKGRVCNGLSAAHHTGCRWPGGCLACRPHHDHPSHWPPAACLQGAAARAGIPVQHNAWSVPLERCGC